MTDGERCLRYSEAELAEMKRLYESVMSFAAHGMFFRTGKIMGKRISEKAMRSKDYFAAAAEALVDAGWAEEIDFNGKDVFVKGSIERVNGSANGCHLLRGVLTRVYEEYYGHGIGCAEIECEGSGSKGCRFKVDGGEK
jgi:predicted hydrocarbon binding protein